MTYKSALGRPLDISYPTNKTILVLSGAALLGFFVFRIIIGAEAIDALLFSLGSAVAVFLSWALGREIDPDYPYSAFIGAVLIIPAILQYGLPSFLALFWLLLALRMTNRTAGFTVSWFDSIIILGLGILLIIQRHWIYGAAAGLFFVTDALLNPKNRRQFIFAAGAAGGSIILSLLGLSPSAEASFPQYLGIGVLTASALFLLVIFTSRNITSKTDITDEPLFPIRVQSSQALALLTTLFLSWSLGEKGVVQLLPLWIAMIGAGLYRPFALIFKLKK